MSGAALRWLLFGLFLVAVLVSVSVQEDDRELSQSSYGAAPWGYGAVFDLLHSFDPDVERSLARGDRLPADATVWWLDPSDLCSSDGDGSEVWHAEDWVAAGGTAVVLLGARAEPCLLETQVDGFSLPWRAGDGREGRDDETARAHPGMDPSLDFLPTTVRGSIVPEPRPLPGPLRVFQDASVEDWEAYASADGAAFVVGRAVGEGRFVLVADSHPLTNDHLGDLDAAPFAMDLVAAFGAPLFDERSHGFAPGKSAARYLFASPAVPALLGIVLAASAFAWMRQALPQRSLADDAPNPPTLEAFVDSLSALYSRSADHAGLDRRYRRLAWNQLRRALRLPADCPEAVVVETLERRRGITREQLEPLVSAPPASSAAAFQSHSRRLDGILQEVVS